MALDPSVLVHPTALIESQDIGLRTRLWAHVHVLAGARIGCDCNLGDGVFVEGGVVIGNHCTLKNGISVWTGVTLQDGVFCGPSMVFTNDRAPRAHPDYRGTPEDWQETLVRHGASIGANATIVCGITIGRFALVGAAALVTKDVLDHALVVGMPARRVGWVCRCARRLEAAGEARYRCEPCGHEYERTETGLALVPE